VNLMLLEKQVGVRSGNPVSPVGARCSAITIVTSAAPEACRCLYMSHLINIAPTLCHGVQLSTTYQHPSFQTSLILTTLPIYIALSAASSMFPWETLLIRYWRLGIPPSTVNYLQALSTEGVEQGYACSFELSDPASERLIPPYGSTASERSSFACRSSWKIDHQRVAP